MNSLFQEVYDRIRFATNARTQVELAEVLEIRQSSISDAKRRDSIPADWYMKLFEKFGLNPDWLKKGSGPMYLRIDNDYTPMEAPSGGVMEDPQHYGDPIAKSVVATVYATFCHYEDGAAPPELQAAGKMALPQAYAGSGILVLRMDTEAFAPTVRKGAYVGVDTSFNHPASGEIYAVFMPHEGVTLKRLFLDGSNGCFLLRTDNPEHPESRLDAADCEKRLLGRVSWVLQQL